MKYFFVLFLLLNSLATPNIQAADKLMVAAAADLQTVMPELVKAFQAKHPEISAQVSYESSGTLTTQIEQKAPFDIFFSADSSYTKRLVDKGLTADGKDFRYAQGRLVVWYLKTSALATGTADLTQGLKLLRNSSIKKIAIANPAFAPYGKAAVAALKKEKLYDELKSKFVLGENISQAAQFVEKGAADIGIIASSLANSEALRKVGYYYQVPVEDYPPLVQNLVVIKNSQNETQAKIFKEFILSPQAAEIFRNSGYQN